MENERPTEDVALAFLPNRIAESVRRAMALYRGNISEIRIRADSGVFITVKNKNIYCGVDATCDDVSKIVRSLCGNSLYSHSETIKEGYISVYGGIRAGVCGRAVTENGRILSLTDISSVCIRIPHRIIGAADPIVKEFLNKKRGVLIYSDPGVGKTTALREFSAVLASEPYNYRVAVVDTRFEICGALNGKFSIDVLSGYPRAKGIETALRVLSPEIIVCDEISSREDAEALFASLGAGVPVAASVHAGSYEELMRNDNVAALVKNNVFSILVHLRINEGKNEIIIQNLEEVA